MPQYINKSALVAEAEKIREQAKRLRYAVDANCIVTARNACECLESSIDLLVNSIGTLEVKEVDTWHLQEKENIYNAVKGWSLQTFVCVMKDGSIQKFTGSIDDDYKGFITVHIDGVNDVYDDVDDIVKWIELT